MKNVLTKKVFGLTLMLLFIAVAVFAGDPSSTSGAQVKSAMQAQWDNWKGVVTFVMWGIVAVYGTVVAVMFAKKDREAGDHLMYWIGSMAVAGLLSALWFS